MKIAQDNNGAWLTNKKALKKLCVVQELFQGKRVLLENVTLNASVIFGTVNKKVMLDMSENFYCTHDG